MAMMPGDRKDGRRLLLWEGGAVFVGRWNGEITEFGVLPIRDGAWDTGFVDGHMDDPATIAEPTHWADINPPT